MMHKIESQHPYRAGCSIYTHPSQISAIATLHDVPPPSLRAPRILELGSATGDNLLAIAATLPESECVGVELEADLVREASQNVKLAKLQNLSFICGDASACGSAAPFDRPFDFVIAHGLFSWIPKPLQLRLLDECARLLAPGGLLYLSYNCYPRWHELAPWRKLMRLHQADRPPEYARETLSHFSQLISPEEPPPAHLKNLKVLEERLRDSPAFYLAHEYLLDENHPAYFIDVARALEQRGVGYVGDAQLGLDRLSTRLSSEEAATLDRLDGGDRLLREQHLDLLFNVGFRRSIWRKGATAGSLIEERIWDLELLSPYQPLSLLSERARGHHNAQLLAASEGHWSVHAPKALFHCLEPEQVLEATGLMSHALLSLLGIAWPGSYPLAQLYQDTEQLLQGEGLAPPKETRALILRELLQLLSNELLPPPRLTPPPLTNEERPLRLSPLAMAAYLRGERRVGSGHHQFARLPALPPQTLPQLTAGGTPAALRSLLRGSLAEDEARRAFELLLEGGHLWLA